MTWKAFEKELQKLSQTIDDFSPDVIVGIVRGGMIPARLLSNYLQTKKVYCITVEKNGNTRNVTTTIMKDLHGQKVLVVEDMLETGRSLLVVKDYLEKKGAVVKTACLYTMPISEITPDYFLRKIPNVATFPWE